MISIVVVMTNKRVIGKNNKLPWHYPAELKYFKSITMGNTLLMGRKTFESIGKPLPGRISLVASKKCTDSPWKEVKYINNLDSLLDEYENSSKELQVIGGAQLFIKAIPKAHKIYLSILKKEYEGDTFLSPIDLSQFTLINKTDYKDFVAYVYEKQ